MNLPEQIYLDFQEQLPALKEALQTGTAYATELGGRIITYDIVMNSIYILFWVILLSIIGYGFKRHLEWCIKKKWGFNTDSIIIWAFGLFPVAIFFVYNPIPKLIKALTIPEIRLIEIISDLII